MAYPYQPYQPGLYQPYQYQPMQQMQPIQIPQQLNQPFQAPTQPAQATQMPTDERIWVQGENAATAYLVAANGFVRLWDSTAPVFYEKSADVTGKPLPMVVYDYKRRGGEPVEAAPAVDYTGQIKALEERNAALERRIEALEKKRTVKKEAENDG